MRLGLVDPWRGEGDKCEFWIKPVVWAEELCGDEMDPQDVAMALKELSLLRTQDDREFQIVAKVRGKPTRVYAVRNAILSWRQPVTAQSYNGYCDAKLEPLGTRDNAMNCRLRHAAIASVSSLA
jgi:hypothetical protein